MRDTFTLILYLCKTFIQRWMTVVLFFYLLCSDITEMIDWTEKSYSLDYPFTHARTRTHTDAYIHACAHILTHINARTYIHTRTHAHTLTRAHTHTHTHTHTRARTRARTHTHTHTLWRLLNAPLMTAVLSPRKRIFLFCLLCFATVVSFSLGSRELLLQTLLSMTYVFCFCFIGWMSLFSTVLVIIYNTLLKLCTNRSHTVAVHFFDTVLSKKGVLFGCYLDTCICPLTYLIWLNQQSRIKWKVSVLFL